MVNTYIPIIVIALFVIYALYILLIKKDSKRFKAVFYPGVFFIAIWIVIYYFLLK